MTSGFNTSGQFFYYFVSIVYKLTGTNYILKKIVNKIIASSDEVDEELRRHDTQQQPYSSTTQITLAREQLLTAEERGKLCRDDTIDCMRFYPNRFLQEEYSRRILRRYERHILFLLLCFGPSSLYERCVV